MSCAKFMWDILFFRKNKKALLLFSSPVRICTLKTNFVLIYLHKVTRHTHKEEEKWLKKPISHPQGKKPMTKKLVFHSTYIWSA